MNSEVYRAMHSALIQLHAAKLAFHLHKTKLKEERLTSKQQKKAGAITFWDSISEETLDVHVSLSN